MDHESRRVVAAPAHVVVVAMTDTVLLMVTGSHTTENRALVDEVRSTLVVTGTPTEHIDVLWS